MDGFHLINTWFFEGTAVNGGWGGRKRLKDNFDLGLGWFFELKIEDWTVENASERMIEGNSRFLDANRQFRSQYGAFRCTSIHGTPFVM